MKAQIEAKIRICNISAFFGVTLYRAINALCAFKAALSNSIYADVKNILNNAFKFIER